MFQNPPSEEQTPFHSPVASHNTATHTAETKKRRRGRKAYMQNSSGRCEKESYYDRILAVNDVSLLF
ncbi:hypothetical protein AAC387_Pa02g1252 [Persea americana]